MTAWQERAADRSHRGGDWSTDWLLALLARLVGRSGSRFDFRADNLGLRLARRVL